MRGEIVAGVIEGSHAPVILSRRDAGLELQALRRVGLMPAQEALQHVVAGGENISHIMKQSEADRAG